MKKVVIVWPGFTGYLAGPWKELARKVYLKIYIEPSAHEQHFTGEELEGLDWRRANSLDDFRVCVEEIKDFRPDILLSCGWSTPFCHLVGETPIKTKKIFCFDMPWEWRLRKIVARWILWKYLRNFDIAFVPGARTSKYARWLGFKHIVEGSNPSGWERFHSTAKCNKVKGNTGPCRCFLFAGRFVKNKGIDILCSAYKQYRQIVPCPWGLDLVGSGGELPSLTEGVNVVGFVAPKDMPQVFAKHGAFVLPSRWEPWGISATEAMCAGLPVIASDACGFTSDISPTVLVKAGDINSLTAALRHVHELCDEGKISVTAAQNAILAHYSDAAWANRVVSMLEGL